MHVVSKAFWLHKAGNSPTEYEDACWPDKPFEADTKVARFAVADGATEASFSGIWARGLIKAYGKGWFATRNLAKPLAALRSAWHKRVSGKPLPWYAEEKLSMGASSSLVGLTLTIPLAIGQTHGQWESLAVGDSCLFHVRSGDILTAFPLHRSEQFNNYPFLLSSNHERDDSLFGKIARKQGEWKPGDVFYLMTDALAFWLLRRQEEDAMGLVGLADIQTQEGFTGFVQFERDELDANGRHWLRNDDVTLVRIDVS